MRKPAIILTLPLAAMLAVSASGQAGDPGAIDPDWPVHGRSSADDKSPIDSMAALPTMK